MKLFKIICFTCVLGSLSCSYSDVSSSNLDDSATAKKEKEQAEQIDKKNQLKEDLEEVEDYAKEKETEASDWIKREEAEQKAKDEQKKLQQSQGNQ